MRTILTHIRRTPSILLYMIVAWLAFALITTILTTYPLLSDYAIKSPQVFKSLETWQSFFAYTYNSLLGGVVNYISTFLFGVWILCFVIYRRTYVAQGISITKSFNKTHKFGTFGSLAAILGGGCIGCGFTFLTNIFGASLGIILNSLPLKGAELSSLGAIIILISIIRTARQINEFVPESSVSATVTTAEPLPSAPPITILPINQI